MIEYALRLAFFAVAPRLLAVLAGIYPVTGALVQIALSIALLFAGEAARSRVARSRLLRLLFSSQLDFEAHYAKHPPRPFVFYLLFPILLPYWLVNRDARRELLLYKGYTLASFALLLASLVVQYALAFPPQLGVRAFLPIAGRTLLVETIVVVLFLMPMATTFVVLHRDPARWKLGLIVALGLASATWAIVKIHSRRDPVVSWATRQRVLLRAAADPKAALKAEAAALHAAWRALPKERDDVDVDGKVVGDPLEQAQATLATFYKNDEANAFDLWRTRSGKHVVVVVYFEAWKGRDPIWLALEDGATVTHDVKKLPRGAFQAMWRATQR